MTPGARIPAGPTPVFPAGTTSVNIRPPNSSGIQGQVFAVEQMLSLGANGQVPLSWSIRLVAGARNSGARNPVLPAQNTLYRSGGHLLFHPHITLPRGAPSFFLLRTGNRYLALLSRGNV